MNVFNQLIMDASETVLAVEIYHDVKPTIQENDFIINRIKSLDIEFYKAIKNKNISFSFGDKYFAPINEKYCVCIPKDSTTHELPKLINSEELSKEIVSDFLHNFVFKCRFDGYFNISISN
jgi:hypothetical protein